MKLYLVTQEVNNNYDTYDSAVVCAENEEKAKALHPQVGADCKVENVKAEYIGEAKVDLIEGVVCESFNAG